MTLAEQKIRDYLQSAPKGTSREQIADIYNQHQGDEAKIGEAINALWSNKEMDEQETGDWQEVKKKWLKKKPEPAEVKTSGHFGGRTRGGGAAGRDKDFKRPLNGKQVNSSNKTQGNNRPQPAVNGPKTGAWASKTPLAERMKQPPSKTGSGEQNESDVVSPEASQIKEPVPVVNGSAKAAPTPVLPPPQQSHEAKGEEVEAKTPKVNKTATTSWAARLKAGKQTPVVPKPVAKPAAPQQPHEVVSAPVKSNVEQGSSAGVVPGATPPSASTSHAASSTSNEHSSLDKTQHSKLEEKTVGEEKKETSVHIALNKDKEIELKSDSLASTEAIAPKESTQPISESKIENNTNPNAASVDEKTPRHSKQTKVTRRQTLEEIEDQLLGKNSTSFETSGDKVAQPEALQQHSNKTESKDAQVQKVAPPQEPKQEEIVKKEPVPKFTPGFTLPKSLEKHVSEKQPLFSFGFTKSSKNQASETKFTLDNLVRGFNMDLVEAGAIDKLQAKIDSLQQLVRDKDEVIAELKAFKELAQKQAAESQEAAKRKEAAALSELQSSFMPGSESEMNMNSNMDIRDMHGMSDLYGGLPPNYFNKGPGMPSSVVSGVNVNPPPGLKRGDGREIHEMRGDKGKQSVEASPKSTEMGYHVHGGMQGGNGHQQGGMHQNMGMYPPGLPYYPGGVPSQYGFNPNFGGFSPRTQMYQHSMSNMPNINMNSQMSYENMAPQHTSNANMPPSFDMHPQSHTPNFMGFDQSMNLNRPSLGGGSSVDGSATGSAQAYPTQGQPSRRGRGEMSQNVGGMERYGYPQQAPGGGYYPMPQPIYPQQPHYQQQQQQRGMGGGNWSGR